MIMRSIRRILPFILVNLLILFAINLLVAVLGLKPYLTSGGIDYQSLLVMCACWGFGGAFLSLQLSRWAAKRMMRVQLISPDNPGSRLEARVVETVADLCRRAGLETMPEIGIYPSPEINAFATGPSRRRALLAISSGLLDRMDDKAVEGVIGHEITHIVNGDMVMMTLIQGVINTFIYFVAQMAMIAIDNAMRQDNREGRGLGIFAQMALMYVLETALMFLAAPAVAFFSRAREYRADAGSARMTGRETMIEALQELKSLTQIQDNRHPSFAAFKINGRGQGFWAGLFATHPPIDARIEALKRLG